MLKRNLIVIAVVILGLGITSAFGQAREAGSGMATGVKAKPISGKGMRDSASGLATGVKARRTSRSSSRTRKSAKGITYQKIEYVKKPAGWSWGGSQIGAKAKQPRRRSTQKRQHKP